MLDLPAPIDAGWRDIIFNRAIDFHEDGAVEDALEIFRLLAFLAPGDGGVWRALARCHDDLGQHDAAERLRELGQQVDEENLT
ncbi:MAG: hypothetical protein EOO70_04135 [Myxococcaceae bacterium]|nr:MAG: hypothetical protein EOO70_04135 [Myxococcaceae bacterium]